MSHNVRVCGGDKKAFSGGGAAPVLASSAIAPAATSPATGHPRVFAIVGYNSGPAQNIQIFDLAALPANGAVPEQNIPVPGNQYFYEEFGDGIPYFNGCVVCNSSTATTKTIGAADCLMTILYRMEQ